MTLQGLSLAFLGASDLGITVTSPPDPRNDGFIVTVV